MKIANYSVKGTKLAEVTLPKELTAEINLNLLAQAVHVYEERGHTGLRKAKTRAEVNRTGKKLYKQKGTGGARHGSRRAPIFVGGGVAHGPRPLRRVLTLPAKLRKLARAIAYTVKAKENEMVVVKDLGKLEKTKEASELIKRVAKDTGAKRFTFVTEEKAESARKAIRNLENAEMVTYKNANAYDIWNGGMIILDGEVLETGKVQKPSGKATK